MFLWGGNLGVGFLYCVCDVIEYGYLVLFEIEEYSYVVMVNVYEVGVLGLFMVVFRGYVGSDL